jgi:hypothetical protein
MICTKCGKKVSDDGWSNYISENDYSEEWGTAVCFVDEGNVLHEHEVE